MGLQITIPAVAEPVTLEDLKAQVRVVDPQDCNRLTQMGVAAREWCEAYLGQQFSPATYLWTVDRFLALYYYQAAIYARSAYPWQWQSQSIACNRLPNTWYTLWPPRSPVSSIVSIQYIDLNGVLQTLDPSQYAFSSEGFNGQARLTPAYGQYWPPTQLILDAVKITMVCGYSKVPSAIRLAILMLAAHWFDSREAVAYEHAEEVPMGVKSLLDSFATGRYLGGGT